MDAVDTTPLADEYVQDFVLEHFGDMNIKREILSVSNCEESAANAASSCKEKNANANAVPTRTTTELSVVLPAMQNLHHHPHPQPHPQQQQQHPQQPQPQPQPQPQTQHPNQHPQQSSVADGSPPHLLTPPDNHPGEEQQHYHHNHHHHHHHQSQQLQQQQHMHHVHHHHHSPNGVVKASNLVMYQNIPGTPPDTPPVSNSPSPQNHHYPVAHAQSYYTQQMYPKSTLMDEMVWLTQSLRQEPLDLRPNCTGDVNDTTQNWNVLQHQHTSVISGNGKRVYHSDYIHHHQHIQNSPLLSPIGSVPRPLSNLSSTVSVLPPAGGCGSSKMMMMMSDSSERSRSSSRSNSLCSGMNDDNMAGSGGHLGSLDYISDQLLVCLTVKDLNKRLQGIPKEAIARLKQKRRTLKNRGYAQNCRSKRLIQRQELELSKQSLQGELTRLKMELQRALQERDAYKHRYHEIARMQEMHQQHPSNVSAPNISRRGNHYPVLANSANDMYL